jgi:hypothetical protein
MCKNTYLCILNGKRNNMDLREYLFKNRLKVTDFAKIIGYERGYINKVVNGLMIPGRKLAESIEKATNGEVKAEDLLKGEE